MSDNVKPITMTEEQEHRDRNMADSFPCNDLRRRAWAEVDALRARVAELEQKLADERRISDEFAGYVGQHLECECYGCRLFHAHAARRAKEAADGK